MQWFLGTAESKFDSTVTIIGYDKEDTTHGKILNRVIELHEFGYSYEADARHAELTIKGCALEETRSLSTPTSDERNEADEPLHHDIYNRYQSLCARANSLSIDRIDLQFAAKEVCRPMCKPTFYD